MHEDLDISKASLSAEWPAFHMLDFFLLAEFLLDSQVWDSNSSSDLAAASFFRLANSDDY